MAERIYRYIKVDRAGIDKEARRIPISFSSEYPALQRADAAVPVQIKRAAGLKDGQVYIEILDHAADSVDLSMLNNRGAFLDEHDEKDQLGVIEKAENLDRSGKAIVKLSGHEKAIKRFNEMVDDERPHISAGYQYTRFIGNEAMPDGRTAKRFAWKALELSSVAIPADPTIGVARDYKDLVLVDSPQLTESNSNAPIEQNANMKTLAPAETPVSAPAIDEKKLRSDVTTELRVAYQKRRKELRERGDLIVKDFPIASEKVRSIIDEAAETDEAIGEVSFRMLREAGAIKPVKQVTMAGLGYDGRDIASYSLVRGIQNCVLRGKQQPDPDTIEGDAHIRMSKLDLGYSTNGFLVPPDANISQRSLSRSDRRRMSRDMQVNIFGQGGATVAMELVTPIIEILRNRMVTSSLGMIVMAGLEGNVVIPRQTGAGTAYALSEIAQLTVSNQVLDQIALSPKRVGATGQYSKQLVLQSSIDVESFMRDDFLKVIAILWDRLILVGQGAADEPLGVMNTPGVGSVNFGAAATFAKLVSFWTAIASANADVGEMGYVTTPAASGVLQSAAKLLVGATTVAAVPLWEGGGVDGRINGYPAKATNQVPNNQMLFGVFSEIIHALWGGMDVVVDPFTLADKAEVKITMNTWGDVAIRHPQCFAVSSDAANQ